MRIRIVKGLSTGLLLLAVLFWRSVAIYQLAIGVVVTVGAAVVAVQALRARKSVWTAAVVAITVLFGIYAAASLRSPATPFLSLGGGFGGALVLASLVAFTRSLVAVKSQPLYSIASITDRNPGSEAL